VGKNTVGGGGPGPSLSTIKSSAAVIVNLWQKMKKSGLYM
jgi:hypothetical protein